MTRDNIFRFWAIKEKRMYYLFDLSKGESLMTQTGMPLHIAPLDFFIPMQFTGMLDKNKNRIWESDIAKCKVNVRSTESVHSDYYYDKGYVEEVKFATGSFYCKYYLDQIKDI